MIFFLLAALSFLIFAYPFLIYPKLLQFLPKRPLFNAAATSAKAESFALVFCAYNEEKSIVEKISNIRKIKEKNPGLEVFAYSDMSTDLTFDLLKQASDVLTPVAGTKRLGKASGMRLLVSMARSDVIVFTDANVILDEDAIEKLGKYFADPAIGTVSGRLKYLNEGDSVVSDVGGRYWSLEERIKTLESETGSTMGADGSIFAMRRSLYPEVPPHLLDDLIASITPLFKGYRVISAPDVVAYERLTTDGRDEYRRRRRIACRGLNTHRHLYPSLRKMAAIDKFKYASHRLVRWFSPMFLFLSAVFFCLGMISVLGPWLGLSLCLSAVVLFWLLWRSGQSRARQIGEILITLFATSLGILESLAGKTYQTWTPAESRNG